MTERIEALPKYNGIPVPHFATWDKGKPDFRVIDQKVMIHAYAQQLCWVCGQPHEEVKAFCIGPMCAVTQTIGDPACHVECATYAAKHCPFLSNPSAKRNSKGLPRVGKFDSAAITRNPGSVCVWTIKGDYTIFYSDDGNPLFDIGDEPIATDWYCEGRTATRGEAWESIQSGLPILRKIARQQNEAAVAELNRRIEWVATLLPEKTS